jgi:hypothetical protein
MRVQTSFGDWYAAPKQGDKSGDWMVCARTGPIAIVSSDAAWKSSGDAKANAQMMAASMEMSIAILEALPALRMMVACRVPQTADITARLEKALAAATGEPT